MKQDQMGVSGGNWRDAKEEAWSGQSVFGGVVSLFDKEEQCWQ
jgi:hypothetical protein